ncbi:hypothetical protein CCUS01_10511 [Colletotrichum cuscutae]|uniref:Uncharacterized protein n=1 Tax=Colletotrichum cuscutae TaxID=1209917 RepID=A0AAI9UDE8_9PEZI|nr:hypothetical protein CCUS01_10511 [Colletotrichum cuscutae]
MGKFTTFMSLFTKVLKPSKRVLRETTRTALPVVQTITATRQIQTQGRMGKTVVNAAGEIKEAINGLSVIKSTPEVQMMCDSCCSISRATKYFERLAEKFGPVAGLYLIYQGVQALEMIGTNLKDIASTLGAQTALKAHKDFSRYVYQMLQERIGQTAHDLDRDHWFFVYHPDNDWYPDFYERIQRKPISPRFIAHTHQLDAVFILMLAARMLLRRRANSGQDQGNRTRNIAFHLLIPAYRPMFLAEPVKIPEDIGDFVIEGRIHHGDKLVHINLPEEDIGYVNCIELRSPNVGWFDWALSTLGWAEEPRRRVLGREPPLST